MTAALPSDWAHFRIVPKTTDAGDVLCDVEYIQNGDIDQLGTDVTVPEALELLDINLFIQPWRPNGSLT